MSTQGHPHQGQRVLTYGEPLASAKAAMVMIHGRGASAEDILSLAPELNTAGVAYLAPQAAGNTWYPYPFLAPIQQNEPYLSSALRRIEEVLAEVEAAGISPEKTMLLGFSQGACLSLEFSARHARRYGGVFGLSGGLIGPPGTVFEYPGSLENTPVFLGCSDVDFHIPAERVNQSAEALAKLGGNVTQRLYPGMGHTINQDEIDFVRGVMAGVVS
jgi:phospholipase/carboxylesterase